MSSLIFTLPFGVGLGWSFTAAHYSHKSQNAYCYLGPWWTGSELKNCVQLKNREGNIVSVKRTPSTSKRRGRWCG